MIQLLIDSPLLLLFVVAAIGYPLGRIKIGGTSLGVAAVLFVGLAIGALDPDLKLPELVYQLGLVIFVYTIGLSSGAAFFASFRRKGLRDNLFVVGLLVVAAVATLLAQNLLQLKPTVAAGMYTGSLTNTAALAGVLEYLKGSAPQPALDQLLAEPVVGFSITYPMGVVAMILIINFMQRLWKIDYAAEAKSMHGLYAGATNERLDNRTIHVTRPGVAAESIEELIGRHTWDVIFGRAKHDSHLSLVSGQTRPNRGDLVSVVGTHEDLDRATTYLGEVSDERLEFDRNEFDYRRMFVSNPKVAGHRLSELNLPQRFSAIVTRVRRGDVEMLAHADTVLELGDRVRVVTQRENMDAVSTFFGDSYRAVSEVDILTFSLGLGLGLLLGMVPIPLPGGVVVKLGLAGGPLVVALILGTLRHTGPMVWSLPYSANQTLRQVGLILFLAGVGTRAGYAFVTTLTQGGGVPIFVAGTIITGLTAWLALWIGHRLLKMPMSLLIGMLAGLQTQPAVLGFALEQTRNDLPNVGHAAVYPVAIIIKILLAQLLLALSA